MENRSETDKSRPRCPFYGFHYAMGALIDSNGNQCAMIVDSYSPCQMERNGEEIDWNNCKLNNERTEARLQGSLEEASVFPKELKPEGVSTWSGIPFGEWYAGIIQRK